jgi:hypothetical protein
VRAFCALSSILSIRPERLFSCLIFHAVATALDQLGIALPRLAALSEGQGSSKSPARFSATCATGTESPHH